MPGGKTKVAVLGGGMGSLAAAFELTRPERGDAYEVTVFQPGWRLGGKGASGRNLDDGRGNRIEEHGLHLWFGFYVHAFKVMHEAYASLPEDWPIRDVADAFSGCETVTLYDKSGEEWHSFAMSWPKRPHEPWEVDSLPGFWEVIGDATQLFLDKWRELRGGVIKDDAAPPGEGYLIEPAIELARRLQGAAKLPDWLGIFDPMGRFVDLISGFRDWVFDMVGSDHAPVVRLFMTTLDAFVAIVKGIKDDELLDRGFESVDDEEWSAWLSRHGASEMTIGATPAERAPVLRAVYDLAFGYVGGEVKGANVAAGTATNDLLRLMFTYGGNLFYKMRAGMGDIVFAPLYEVLRARGVKFRFFSAVSRVGVADDDKSVDEIDVVTQAELAPGRDSYDPLVRVNKLPCWPNRPMWEQLAEGDRVEGTDFEGEVDPFKRGAKTLCRGEDFDQVVLGIPVGAHPEVCGELITANARFKEMVDASATVRTQAVQLWLRDHSEALGWKHGLKSVAGSYVEPLDTYCDMSDLLAAEGWQEHDGVQSLAYLCGVMPDHHGKAGAEATAHARQNGLEFLRGNGGPLWPSAVSPDGALRWELLHDHEDRKGEARMDAQYWRANTSAWERYVLSPAGSLKHRLAPGASGFENVVLAGDWTKNGVDGGCVEAATLSGLQAAAAITGEDPPLVGQDTRWLHPARSGTKQDPAPQKLAAPAPDGGAATLPRYVEYGGQSANPGPFECKGGRIRTFVLEGDGKKIKDLVDRTLNQPAGGAVEYHPIGSMVALMIGEFAEITSTVEPWSTWGSARETQASLWIPMVAGVRKDGRFDAKRFCMSVPYALVDNPMSYSGGREDYGYPKTMANFMPADGQGDEIKLEVYGGTFAPEAQAAWLPLLEIRRAGAAPVDDDGSDGPLGLINDAAGLVRGLAGGALGAAEDLGGAVAHTVGDLLAGHLPETFDVNLASDFVDSMLAGRGRQVMLKQFRDALDGQSACYQAVIEAPVRMTKVSGKPNLGSFELTFHALDSHPIERELGVGSQRVKLAIDMEMEFVMGEGTTVTS